MNLLKKGVDMISYLKSIFKVFKENIHFFFKYDLNHIQKNLTHQNAAIWALKKKLVEQDVEKNPELAQNLSDEVSFLRKQEYPTSFPYPTLKHIEKPAFGRERKNKLPYIIHNGKKLFFPKHFQEFEIIELYTNYIERENLLGGNFTTKAPHQYQSEKIHIERDDILLDIGCAEGLIALDAIDRVKKVYLFEGEEMWLEPLKATFEPYVDRVEIIPKFVGSKNTPNTTDLNSIFKDYTNGSFFVKMDIEGCEEDVLRENQNFFSSSNHIKIACCLYHKAEHQISIPQLLNNWHYQTEFSSGVMFFHLEPNLNSPFLRKGLIRAIKY